jgi:DNA-binding CsgD family transcriptional regulator
VQVDDPALSERLTQLLSEIPGLSLVSDPAEADVALVDGPGRNGNQAGVSQRELEVLALLIEGASNKEIARRLGISVHTAKFHVRSLMNKVDARGRTEAVAQAARLHLIRL